jgi:hypothetical protein
VTVIDSAVISVIRRVAAQYSRRLPPHAGTWEDISQDLLVHCLERIGKYDPTRAALPTFVDRIIKNKVASTIEHMLAQKRGAGAPEQSLSEPVAVGQSGETVERGETISEGAYYMKIGRRSRPDAEIVELQIDVARVVASLPPHLASLARRLAWESVVAAARSTGVSRATAHRNLDVVRAAFVQAGLDLYTVRRHPVQGDRRELIGAMRRRKSMASHQGGNS